MGLVTIEIGFSTQPIAWASGQLKFRTEVWQIRDVICSTLISILRTNNMFSKWEGGVGRRRLEFVDFAILVNLKFLFDWLSFELSIFR